MRGGSVGRCNPDETVRGVVQDGHYDRPCRRYRHGNAAPDGAPPARPATMCFPCLLPAVSCSSHIDTIVIAHAMAM